MQEKVVEKLFARLGRKDFETSLLQESQRELQQQNEDLRKQLETQSNTIDNEQPEKAEDGDAKE